MSSSSSSSSSSLSTASSDRALEKRRATPRPPWWIGVSLWLLPPVLLATGALLGLDLGAGVVLSSLFFVAGGIIESSRSLESWWMARRTKDFGIVVERGLITPVVLRLPLRPGATAMRAQVLFAATNDLVWRISLPRDDLVEFTVTKRGLLSRSDVTTGDTSFDQHLVLESRDDAMSVLSRVGPEVRRALLGLFARTSARRVRFGHGEVDVDFPRRGNDVEPVLTALPPLKALCDAIELRPTLPPSALRAHSPEGSSTAF